MSTGRKRARGKGPGRPRVAQEAEEAAVLFVRGFPAPLLREARALASLRGVAVREIIAQALRGYLAEEWKGRP